VLNRASGAPGDRFIYVRILYKYIVIIPDARGGGETAETGRIESSGNGRL
jgi:hypothetical protein